MAEMEESPYCPSLDKRKIETENHCVCWTYRSPEYQLNVFSFKMALIKLMSPIELFLLFIEVIMGSYRGNIFNKAKKHAQFSVSERRNS